MKVDPWKKGQCLTDSILALIDDSHIQAQPYFDIPSTETNDKSVDSPDHNESQEAKPKSRIAAEILANGYVLQDQIVAKGLEYDNKYNVSSRLTGFLSTIQNSVKQFDEKYRIWDKAVGIDQKYQISEKVQTATQTAQEKAQAALQTTTGQKVHELANQTLAEIAAVHYEAKKIQVSLVLFYFFLREIDVKCAFFFFCRVRN